MCVYVPYQKSNKKCIAKLFLELLAHNTENKPVLILCIGTDRATGDAFGPLVGTFLKSKRKLNASVLGTVEKPIHAKNLHEVDTSSYYTIAIDACLGPEMHFKHYCFDMQSISPGKGVKKNLPPVGDCSVLFNVNISSPMNMVMLQNTRLFDVYYPAVMLSEIIYENLKERKSYA